MKKYFIIVFVIVFTSIKAQTNLVPNPSFETYTACPQSYSGQPGDGTTPDYTRNAPPWQMATQGTADYFNACDTTSNVFWGDYLVGVPRNQMGYQYARTGNAYMGLWTKNSHTPYREYICAPLSSTLISATNYYVSFYVCLAEAYENYTNRIGAYLSNGYPDTTSTYNSTIGCDCYCIHKIPQIENPTSNLLTDTLNWVKISGWFTASGGENWITIGNFSPDSLTAGNDGYYYIDDIYIGTDSTEATSIHPFQTKNEEIKIYPNPASIVIQVTAINYQNEAIKTYDVLGNEVLQSTQKEIDVSSLPNGMYYLKVGNSTQKFVKQ